ncbi:PREDICTED: integrin beta-PS-like [Polistes canadensis]|uniref:integrin beta-PS-like n=1 Tax=Polistes canadensis TaxID=91411 RepID=UPI000718B6D4|nr:PREDICTED: integrin beta-PS-like [Polistes canadensis]
MHRSYVVFSLHAYLFLSIIILVSGEYKDSESICASQETCGKCLQTPKCVWCSTNSFGQNEQIVRCVTREKLLKEGDLWCKKHDVVDIQNSMTIIENLPLSSVKGKNPVQIQPQRIKLRLRKDEEYRIILKYSQAEDYPVDLYFLMDISFTMRVYKEKLSKLAVKLQSAMKKLTSNFRLGFGSFVDKVVLPMSKTQKSWLKNPCYSKYKRTYCVPSYGFKHQLSLTDNAILFQDRVMKTPHSANNDIPEGCFDALMQAIVCSNEIGWREKARHLLVLSTDGIFHLAGDGKLAGIVEPNDCQCHLDEQGYYSHSLLQDYPSIAQIAKKSREHNVNIIFALPLKKNNKYYRIYQNLSEIISGSSIDTMEGNGENIVALISRQYEQLVSSVSIMDNAPNFINVKYYSRCLNATEKLMEWQECGGLRVGNVVEFEIVLKAFECPKNLSERQQVLQIKPRGINESLTVDIEILCDCPCEKKDNSELNSVKCKRRGTLTCGICFCNDGFYGKQCECEGHEFGSSSQNVTEDCKASNTSDEICSGHGACKCGVCNCMKRENPQEIFYGKYCECDNFSCKRSGDEVCGKHGKCECGRCNCRPGFSGETCDCKETNSTCILPSTDKAEKSSTICSGRGDCICGKCHCHEKDKIRYSGEFCEECPNCPGQRCEELKDCVECMAYGTGPLAQNGTCNCYYQISIVDVVKEDSENDYKLDTHYCRTDGDGGCFFAFKYEYVGKGKNKDNTIKILVQKKPECPVPIDVFGVALGVAISVILAGLLIILIWKIATMVHDKREYEKFERERVLATWGRSDNPLYKQAVSTFSNPTFKGNEETT